jgi:hypothetical protein
VVVWGRGGWRSFGRGEKKNKNNLISHLSSSFLPPQKTQQGYHYQLPSVAAWSGEAGMGTKLAEATLPWTVGNFTYPSSWGGLKWKGVAKSVTFSPAVIEGYSLMATALFADVSVTVLSNKTAPLGGKVADAVTELGAKATDAKAAVASLKGAMPDLPALPKKMGE